MEESVPASSIQGRWCRDVVVDTPEHMDTVHGMNLSKARLEFIKSHSTLSAGNVCKILNSSKVYWSVIDKIGKNKFDSDPYRSTQKVHGVLSGREDVE
jgi:hypothetical protein